MDRVYKDRDDCSNMSEGVCSGCMLLSAFRPKHKRSKGRGKNVIRHAVVVVGMVIMRACMRERERERERERWGGGGGLYRVVLCRVARASSRPPFPSFIVSPGETCIV